MIDQSPFAGGVQRGRQATDYFAIIAHHMTRYPGLSFGSKGLLALILGLPRWQTLTEESLAAYSTDGVKTIRGYLVELREHGFLERGERQRYPKGAVNSKGKPIGGALGPYRWFATDQLDEVSAILQRKADEQAAQRETAGHDYRPDGPPGSPDPVDNSNLAAQRAGSSDQAKQPVFQDQNYRPDPPGGSGRTNYEEQPPLEELEEQGDAPASGREPSSLRSPGPESSTAASVGGSPQRESVGDHLTARGRDASSSAYRWHGAGALSRNEDPAAQHELNRVKTRGRVRSASWAEQRDQRQQRDPAKREAVREELERRRGQGPQRAPVPTPPASGPGSGVIPPGAAPPVAQSRSRA